MKKHSADHYKEELKREGFRVTPQRLEVIRALVELDHPTAKSVREEVEKRHPMTSPSTVYGAVNLLEEMGELTPIQGETETRYDLSPTTHPHLIHEETGKVEDLEEEIVQEKLSELAALAPEATTRVELNFYLTRKETE